MREMASLEIITILLTAVLVFWTTAKLLFPLKFNDYAAVLNITRYLKVYGKEEKGLSLFNVLLSCGSILSFTVLSYFFLNLLGYKTDLSWGWIATLAVVIAAYFALKQLFERIIGSIFDIDDFTEQLVFMRTTYRNYAGALAFVATVLMAYALPNNSWITYAALFLIAIIMVVGNYTFYRTNEKLILGNFFYFILYLCALEIGPLIIVLYILGVLG